MWSSSSSAAARCSCHPHPAHQIHVRVKGERREECKGLGKEGGMRLACPTRSLFARVVVAPTSLGTTGTGQTTHARREHTNLALCKFGFEVANTILQIVGLALGQSQLVLHAV